MSGGNFDDTLYINDDGCLTPTGPLELAKGESVLRLDVWIWQKASACMAFQRNCPADSKWKIPTVHHENHVGPDFQPGEAFAMGLMVVKLADGQTKSVQWAEGIGLQYEKSST